MGNFHFIAVGGAVMHQLAILLKKQGNQVTGSDDVIFDPAKTNLQQHGILPQEIGWNPTLIHKNLDAIILGMHARIDNPELLRAQELNIPVYSFPEFIFKQSLNKKRVVVGGSHGKTTTTAMIIHALTVTGKKFDYLVGSKLDGLDYMVDIHPEHDLIIIEGDEYLSSPLDLRSKFLHYHPHIAILTGIAWDHINVFPTYESYLDTFREFVKSIDDALIYNIEDEEVKKLVGATPTKCLKQPYKTLEFNILNGIASVLFQGKTYPMKIFGRHNFSNMSSAMSVCKELGVNEDTFLTAMQSFGGTAKRLEKIWKDEEKNVSIYRDFAHAPSKVKATVQAVREQFPKEKIVALFEIHTYSSMQDNFLSEYKDSLNGCDVAAVYLDEESLRIKQKEKIPADRIFADFNFNNLGVFYEPTQIKAFLINQYAPNTVFLLMSSGHLGGLNFVKLFSEMT